MQSILSLHPAFRIILLMIVAVTAHFIIRILKKCAQRLLSPKSRSGAPAKEIFTIRHPKLASLITIIENVFSKRVIALMKTLHPDYCDRMAVEKLFNVRKRRLNIKMSRWI